MNEKTYKPSPGKVAESIFDICYLLFDLVAAIIFFATAHGNSVLILFGILTVLLGGGDAFHLIPRVVDHLKGPSPERTHNMQLGVLVSSVTMTVFYLVLYVIFTKLFPGFYINPAITWIIWLTAVFRIIVCLMPQNGWFKDEENLKWSLLRNLPFAVTGFFVMLLFFMAENLGGYHIYNMGIAIILSFGFYFPVTLFAKKKPWVGSLMMPKTLAYVWMISIGLSLIGNI